MFQKEQDEAEKDTCTLEKEQHHMLVEAQVHDDRDQDRESETETESAQGNGFERAWLDVFIAAGACIAAVEQNRQQQKELATGCGRQWWRQQRTAPGKEGQGNGGRRGPHEEGRGRASRCAGVRGEHTLQEAPLVAGPSGERAARR